jgi:hypothetical protein
MAIIRRFKDAIRQFSIGVRNIIKWIPVLYKDRDWDFYYVYNILQKKLEFTEKAIRDSSLENGGMYANKIRTAIKLIEIVRDEKYLDEILMERDWSMINVKKIIAKQDKAKKVLFNYLHHYIEQWWS